MGACGGFLTLPAMGEGICPIINNNTSSQNHGIQAGAAGSRKGGPMDEIAREYIVLVLSLGHHDKDYVDAYYGPGELRDEADKTNLALDVIGARAAEVVARLEGIAPGRDVLDQLRHQYLLKQLSALRARVRMLQGERLSFDEESRALYDAVAPVHTESHFQEVLDRLEKRFPGSGPLVDRYDAWRRHFVVPREKLDAVFQAAIRAGRGRTASHVALPAGEQFTLEYVTGKSWSGYNWYKGNSHSLIQINTDLPIYIDRAVDLACHEGYPGHHVYNALLEQPPGARAGLDGIHCLCVCSARNR